MARQHDEEQGATGHNGFLKRLGPGLITGASDDDPSGIGTYSQAGAQLGFGIGWTMLLTYPLMVAIQEISGRIGRSHRPWYCGKCSATISGCRRHGARTSAMRIFFVMPPR